MGPDSALLTEMANFAAQQGIPIVNPATAGLLMQTVREQRPARILEIGTAIGYSTILMAMNSPPAEIITIENNPARVALAAQYLERAKLAQRVKIITGDAGELISSLTGKFDLVFIDAAKGQYLDYLLKIIDKLNDQALVIADNVLFRGMVTAAEPPVRRFRTIVKRLRAYLEYVNNSELFSTRVFAIGDGVSVSRYVGGKCSNDNT